jgi:hypothetical protein
MNHIATGRARNLGGELLPPHHGRQQRWWRWQWSQWRWLRGQFPVPAGCRNVDFCPPKLVFDGGGAAELFVNGDWFLRVFGSERIYRWKGDVRGWTRGPHHLVARPGGPAPPYCVPASWPSSVSALDSVIVSGKIGGLAFVSSNYENIPCVTFLKYKNSRKRELTLWHLVNRLVPKNA